jgi:hypothetical protein
MRCTSREAALQYAEIPGSSWAIFQDQTGHWNAEPASYPPRFPRGSIPLEDHQYPVTPYLFTTPTPKDKKPKCPTWTRIHSTLIISLEHVDGTPDFYISRDKGKWYAKWRTSAHWDGPFATAAAAMRDVERGIMRSIHG